MTENKQNGYIITEDELDELVAFGAVSLVTETRARISELVVAIRARMVSPCDKGDMFRIPKTARWSDNFALNKCCASHTSAVTLTPALTVHYAVLSAQQGKPVSELVALDLEEYQEYRRWLVNEAERL